MTPKHCPKCGCLMTFDDEGAPYHHGKHWAETDFTFCLKRQLDAAQQRIKRLEEAVAAYQSAYEPDGHIAPHDCFATGPRTGDLFMDLVACPGCFAAKKAKEAKP